ncbi:MAG: 50S ribosomal protein L21 [Acidobacteria bacterium]|nr:50S ribosomal protein L21 [Acidobacteriota bacterium]
MFAIIESGGKQYRVEPGDVLDVELMGSLAPQGSSGEKGTEVRFERVLTVGGTGSDASAAPTIGKPLIEGALVTASLVGESRGPKIRVFKHKHRNTQRKTIGHRQHYHRIRIDAIQLP